MQSTFPGNSCQDCSSHQKDELQGTQATAKQHNTVIIIFDANKELIEKKRRTFSHLTISPVKWFGCFSIDYLRIQYNGDENLSDMKDGF